MRKFIETRRYGAGYHDQDPAMQAEIRRIGMRVDKDGTTYLPAVPFSDWKMIRLGPIGFKGPMMFVWLHDHYCRAKLQYTFGGGRAQFWAKYARCRLLRKHDFMMSTFSFKKQEPAETFKCMCCGKPTSAMVTGKDRIGITDPMMERMLSDGVDPARANGIRDRSVRA